MENNSIADIVKSRRESGEGIASSLGGALKEKVKEKLDWKRALPQGGLLTALFPKLKAYKAQKANSPTSKVVKLISSNLESIAKSSRKIKSISKNISGMKKEVNKFAKLENVTPATTPEVESGTETTPSFVSKAMDFVKSNSTAILIGLALAGVGVAFTLAFDTIKSTISDAFDKFVDFGFDIFDKLGDSITGAFDSIKKFGGEVYDNMKESITSVYDGLKDFGNVAYDKIGETITSISDNVVKAKDNVLSLIKDNKAEESVTPSIPMSEQDTYTENNTGSADSGAARKTANERRAANRQANNTSVKGIDDEASSTKPEIFNPNNESSSTSATDTSKPNEDTSPSKNAPSFGIETGGGAVTSMQRGSSNTIPGSLKGQATSATPTMAGGAISDESSTQLAQKIGLSKDQWEIYRNTIASIESGGKYDISGGAGNHYDGRYQLGRDAKIDAARIAGVSNPGHDDKGREAFRKDPKLQELLFAGLTVANDGYLKNLSKTYRDADVTKKMEILAYAHNQGAGGAAKWLESGVAGKDAFGTAGTKYSTAIASNLKGETSPSTNMAAGIREGRGVGPGHDGIDIAAPIGTPVQATSPGKVIAASFEPKGFSGYGNIVIVESLSANGEKIYTKYAHLSAFDVKVGDTIEQGGKIGKIGNTGRSSGPHLHYEMRKGDPVVGAVIDPKKLSLISPMDSALKQSPGAPVASSLKGQQRQAAAAAPQPNAPQQSNNQNNQQTAPVYSKNVANILLNSLINGSGYGLG